MTQHDFKAALGDLRPYIVSSGDMAAIVKPETIDAIRTALRIADRLQSGEVSDGVVKAGANQEWSDGYDRNGSHSEGKYVEYQTSLADCVGGWRAETVAAETFRAMAQQLIKECE